MESLFEAFSKRNPEWEIKYQNTIMDVFAEYGKGSTQYQEIRGKLFGAGYEMFIIAFFIGLYADKKKALIADKSKRKTCGQPIMYWGNVESRNLRIGYGRIREYIFAALVARTDVDFIAFDKGELKIGKVVDMLINTMEEYANFGFSFIQEKLEDNPNYFYNDTAFVRVFLDFLHQDKQTDNVDVEPEEL